MARNLFSINCYLSKASFAANKAFQLGNLTTSKCYILVRNYSSVSSEKQSIPVKKSVFVSKSNDIFSNLALEDWFYRNYDFSNHHVLMLWQNNPCVVIGRHQNPWQEANVSALTELGITLARRNSGGGTVYHDLGNLNLTFFTSRKEYNRKTNLELICKALHRSFGLTVTINKKEDLTIKDKYKISGTAAKLGRPNAYHHCTLLVNVDKVKLKRALELRQTGIISNATKSIPSPVLNLVDDYPSIRVEPLMTAVGLEYLHVNSSILSGPDQFETVDPDDETRFPGVTELREHYSSWEWRFEKTPNFSINQCFTVPSSVRNESIPNVGQELQVTIQVKQGRVADVIIHIPAELGVPDYRDDFNVVTSLKGRKFTEEIIHSLESSKEVNFITKCVQQVVKNSV